jgi:hypothetical protein
MTPFTFLRKQHPKRDEDGYLYTSRHIRVLFAFSLAQEWQVSGRRQRISTMSSARRWSFVLGRLHEHIERTAEFQSPKTPSFPSFPF